MALVFNTKTYTADSFNANNVAYIGAAKTVTVKDDLRLARTAAKATATYSGNGRTEAKMTRTHTLTGALTPSGDSIFRIEVSLPAGIASADVDALCADMSALVAHADFKTHLKTQKINY
jgi:hypothetical protein